MGDYIDSLNRREEHYLLAKKLMSLGTIFPVVGPSGSGKSTFLSLMPEGEIPADLLNARSADGNGTLVDTLLCFSNHTELEKESLYVHCSFAKATRTMAEDGENAAKFFCYILFELAYLLEKENSSSCTEAQVKEIFQRAMEKETNNDGYQVKLQQLENYPDLAKNVMDSFLLVKSQDLLNLFQESVISLKEPKKINSTRKEKFLTLFQDYRMKEGQEEQKSFVLAFANFCLAIVEYFNEEILRLREKVEHHIARWSGMQEGDTYCFAFSEEMFLTELNEEEEQAIDNLTSIFLQSEDSSKEFFISELSFLCRGKDLLFQEGKPEQGVICTTSPEGEITSSVHCVRFKDSKGIGHSSSSGEAETERLSQFWRKHCSSRLVLIESLVANPTAKESKPILNQFLENLKKYNSKGELQIQVVKTHLDDYSNKIGISSGKKSIRSRIRTDDTENQDKKAQVFASLQEEVKETKERLRKNYPNVKLSVHYFGLSMEETIAPMLTGFFAELFKGEYERKVLVHSDSVNRIRALDLTWMESFLKEEFMNASRLRYHLARSNMEVGSAYHTARIWNLDSMTQGFSRETGSKAKYHLDSNYLDEVPTVLSPVWDKQGDTSVFDHILAEDDTNGKIKEKMRDNFHKRQIGYAFNRSLVVRITKHFLTEKRDFSHYSLWYIFQETQDKLFPQDKLVLTPLMKQLLSEELKYQMEIYCNECCIHIMNQEGE